MAVSALRAIVASVQREPLSSPVCRGVLVWQEGISPSIHRDVRFRLLTATPHEVAFKSSTYRLEVVQVPVSGMWQLRHTGPAACFGELPRLSGGSLQGCHLHRCLSQRHGEFLRQGIAASRSGRPGHAGSSHNCTALIYPLIESIRRSSVSLEGAKPLSALAPLPCRVQASG